MHACSQVHLQVLSNNISLLRGRLKNYSLQACFVCHVFQHCGPMQMM